MEIYVVSNGCIETMELWKDKKLATDRANELNEFLKSINEGEPFEEWTVQTFKTQ